MPSPIETLIDQSAAVSHFGATSRYAGVPLGTLTTDDGHPIRYVLRRFVPPSPMRSDDPRHVVTDGERLDHLARTLTGDPERFWQLADHNLARHPWELTATPGQVIRHPGARGPRSIPFHPL
jgi:hypothetical protein